jgi:putative transposase
MTSSANTERYKNHRFPGEIISHGVWLYYRFPLSYRDVQELLFARGIDVSHEAIRKWCRKFGQEYANRGSGADGLSPGTNGISTKCF